MEAGKVTVCDLWSGEPFQMPPESVLPHTYSVTQISLQFDPQLVNSTIHYHLDQQSLADDEGPPETIHIVRSSSGNAAYDTSTNSNVTCPFMRERALT